jgi:carboxymethylenebutenolidase
MSQKRTPVDPNDPKVSGAHSDERMGNESKLKIVEHRFELSSTDALPRLHDGESGFGELGLGKFGIYEARPQDEKKIRGGLLVFQEIFGVNSHIRAVTRSWAEQGFVAWAPAFFDHIEKGIELDYDARSMVRGRQLVAELGWDIAIEDTRLAAKALRLSLPPSAARIGLIGFCWGGSLAWLCACRLSAKEINAAVAYYGRATHEFRHEKPNIPALLHFGRFDSLIPIENVQEFQEAQPETMVHVYEAGHGFNCDQRTDFNPQAAQLARERTLSFLETQ